MLISNDRVLEGSRPHALIRVQGQGAGLCSSVSALWLVQSCMHTTELRCIAVNCVWPNNCDISCWKYYLKMDVYPNPTCVMCLSHLIVCLGRLKAHLNKMWRTMWRVRQCRKTLKVRMSIVPPRSHYSCVVDMYVPL